MEKEVQILRGWEAKGDELHVTNAWSEEQGRRQRGWIRGWEAKGDELNVTNAWAYNQKMFELRKKKTMEDLFTKGMEHIFDGLLSGFNGKKTKV